MQANDVKEIYIIIIYRYFRVAFNSLLGLASVNHLHLHAWYLEESLSLEYAVSLICFSQLNIKVVCEKLCLSGEAF